MRLCDAVRRLAPANKPCSWTSSGARTVACQRPELSVATAVTSNQRSWSTRRARSRTCRPATPVPPRVSRPEMSKECHAVAAAGVWIDSAVAADWVAVGVVGAGADVVGAGAGAAVVVEVPAMFASARSWVRVPRNVFMSLFAWIPETLLVLDYCQKVHVFPAPPNVVGRLP